MEKLTEWERKNLLNELNQGKVLTEQLVNHLSPSTSLEQNQFLVENILSSYEKALSILGWGARPVVEPTKPTNVHVTSESPHSFSNSSSRSEIFDQDCKDQSPKGVFKKRKTQPRWSEQVKVCLGTRLDEPVNDGYNWRKYGQKDILGAMFPRGYYRCTHRHTRGCLATKHVQRSDKDTTIFEVTYRGRHTCIQSSHPAMPSKSPVNHHGPEQNKDQYCPQEQQEVKPKPSSETVFNVGGLQVKVEDLDDTGREDIFPSFTFLACTSIGDEPDGNNIFTESIMESNLLMGSFTPPFISPTASESNYFTKSPSHMNSFGVGHNVQTPESGLTEIISAPTSVTNSPTNWDFDIPFDNVDFDTSFSLDYLEFLA